MFEFPCIISLYYEKMQLWQYCLLVTARSLYMFRTLSASETCRVILQLLINNTAKVTCCWFFI